MTGLLRSRIARFGMVAALAIMVSACGEADSGSNTSMSEIDEQRAKWNAAAVEDYDIQYKVRCLCPTKDRRLTVRDGRIERVDYKSAQDNTVANHYDDDDYNGDRGRYRNEDYIYTVESLFSLARDGHRNAHSIYIEYHPTLGYPTDIRIDWDHNWIDDEYQVLIVDFVEL